MSRFVADLILFDTLFTLRDKEKTGFVTQKKPFLLDQTICNIFNVNYKLIHLLPPMRYRNILLIDDDEDDQEIFLAALNDVSNAVQCLAMDKASEALHKLSSKSLTPDLIFLDLNMPFMSGQQFLTEIKKDEGLKNIPVIIFSTSASARTAQETKDLGAYDFITKPDNFEELKNVIKSYLDLS